MTRVGDGCRFFGSCSPRASFDHASAYGTYSTNVYAQIPYVGASDPIDYMEKSVLYGKDCMELVSLGPRPCWCRVDLCFDGSDLALPGTSYFLFDIAAVLSSLSRLACRLLEGIFSGLLWGSQAKYGNPSKFYSPNHHLFQMCTTDVGKCAASRSDRGLIARFGYLIECRQKSFGSRNAY